jgi:signal transduction histidine kinase
MFRTSEGETFIYSTYPIRRLFAEQLPLRLETLVLATPRGEAGAILATLVRPLLLAGLIALVISVVIAFLMARSIYRPISKVTAAVDKMALGMYDQRVPAVGPMELKGLAIRFNELAVKLKQAQQQMRHFVADVAHQLKSPLTSIQGFAEAILDGTADDAEKQRRAAQVINDESRRMIRQVDELLDLSRMQSGQARMAQELVDVKELLLHCQEIFSLRAEEKGIELTADVEPLMPVKGDADRLEQVFSNLLDNALKNAPPRGKVSITGRNSAGQVEVTIADDGPGIPPEQVPHVFERFYQAGGLRVGVGLGLAIAREIVLAHSGTIEVTSNPGEGTEFRVELPATSG